MTEVSPTSPGCPIQFANHFDMARELSDHQYDPLYAPAPVSFDSSGVPWMLVGLDADDRNRTRVQYLDGDYWASEDVRAEFETALTASSYEWRAANLCEQRIVFDDDDDAYLILSTADDGSVLMHRNASTGAWTGYELYSGADYHYRLEHHSTNSDRTGPPAIVAAHGTGTGQTLDLVVVTKAAGVLTLGAAVEISSDATTASPPTAPGNVMVRVGTNLHIVYNEAGNQKAVTYDLSGESLGTAVTMYAGLDDVHYQPVIDADSSGYLHVILGGHNSELLYTVSDDPDDVTDWSTPAEVESMASGRGTTYHDLLVDSADALHVIARRRSTIDDLTKMWLGYWRNSAGAWAFVDELVIPDDVRYAHYYQAVSLRGDDLFCAFAYVPGDFAQKWIAQDWVARYPQDHPIADDDDHEWNLTAAHAPTLVCSTDGGDTWALADTAALAP